MCTCTCNNVWKSERNSLDISVSFLILIPSQVGRNERRATRCRRNQVLPSKATKEQNTNNLGVFYVLTAPLNSTLLYSTLHQHFLSMPKVKPQKDLKAPEMEVLSDASSEASVQDDDVEDEIEIVTDPTISALDSLNDLLENPQDFLHTLLLPPSNGDEDDTSTKELYKSQMDTLLSTSKALFSRLEKIAQMMERVENKQNNATYDENEDECPLSGLAELYTGEANDSDDEDEVAMSMDAETIWGQVDIQNTALVSRVTKSIRKLAKRIDNTAKDGDYQIRLLNMEEMNSGDDVDPEEVSDADVADSDDASEDDSEDEGEDEDEDEDARRVRERMERAMAEMDESGEDEEENENDESDVEKDEEEEDEVDPVREEMNDGFFDLHEMEAFADEEEEMLPNEAFGEPQTEDTDRREHRKKNLPHLRNRAGVDGEEDDEEFNQLEKNMEPSTRRKKYREDDDIDALARLYDEVDEDEDSDSDEDDAANLTAASFFGQPKKPSQEYLHKAKQEKQAQATKGDDSDADSWDNHDFEKEKKGENWRGEEDAMEEDEEQDGDGDQNSENDEEENEEEEESAVEAAKLSGYAERSKKMESITADLEKEALAEKPWQMLGESSSRKRPENSLLENTPEFEFATKMAPIITQEHTESIEEVIKRRVLAEDWDDVVPRELPDIGLDKRNGELPEVSQEKSKLSLGELYEREYLKKATGFDKTAVEKETEEEKARNEMKMLFANICSKLDALSNYHFAPRPVADEAHVKTSKTPAIAMEEVLPLHVSDAHALAPEEIYGNKKGREGILRGESEMDQVSISDIFISNVSTSIVILKISTMFNRWTARNLEDQRKLLGVNQGNPSLQMRSSYLDFSLSLVLTIRMRRERCVKNSKWLEQVERLSGVRLTTTPISRQVRSFSKGCKMMFNKLLKTMIQLVQKKESMETLKQENQASSSSR